MTEEQEAELRYEAGMYQGLYENAKARIEALEFELKAAKNEVEIADSVIEQKRTRIEALEAALRECRIIPHEERCERGTPWDLACTTIAGKIATVVNAALALEQDKDDGVDRSDWPKDGFINDYD